jgi:uncharacterized membrane protein
MKQLIQEKDIRKIFKVSVLLKAADAIIEIIGGVVLIFSTSITGWVVYLVDKELIEDPSSLIATTIKHGLPFFTDHSQTFVAFYLLSHGIVKIILAVALLRNKLWAYPSAIVFFILFIIYQLYRFTYTHSSFLVLLTIFDLFVIVLTWHEYNYMKKGSVTKEI